MVSKKRKSLAAAFLLRCRDCCCRRALAYAADAGLPPVISPVMRKLSAYMAAAAARPLPDAVMEKAKQLTLDAFAAMISGSQLPPGRLALKFADTYKNGSGTIVASQTLCGPVEAALVNAMLAHGYETDDSHPGSESHPGSSHRGRDVGGRRALRHRRHAIPARYGAGLRYRSPFHRSAGRGGLYGLGASQHPRHRGMFRRGGGGRLRGKSRPAADALVVVICSATGFGPCLLAAGHAAHRKVLRLCGDAGARWRYRGPAGAGGRHGRR